MKQRFSLVYLDRVLNVSACSARIDQLTRDQTDASSRTFWTCHDIL